MFAWHLCYMQSIPLTFQSVIKNGGIGLSRFSHLFWNSLVSMQFLITVDMIWLKIETFKNHPWLEFRKEISTCSWIISRIFLCRYQPFELELYWCRRSNSIVQIFYNWCCIYSFIYFTIAIEPICIVQSIFVCVYLLDFCFVLCENRNKNVLPKKMRIY